MTDDKLYFVTWFYWVFNAFVGGALNTEGLLRRKIFNTSKTQGANNLINRPELEIFEVLIKFRAQKNAVITVWAQVSPGAPEVT